METLDDDDHDDDDLESSDLRPKESVLRGGGNPGENRGAACPEASSLSSLLLTVCTI